ncbi:MAG TPA: Sec-independent protein translocase subunit TatA [Pedococcus sp.]|jgi:sec-independent protein translocase protein TatA|nr:Sec-independent protein translocase subunit TatA [Pedococcus sp.]
MLRGLEGWHVIILLVLLVVLFGFRRLPDAARSLGRSMRIFKSEVNEMKNDGRSAASSDTVKGEALKDPTTEQTTAEQTTREQAPHGAPSTHDDPGPREGNASGVS